MESLNSINNKFYIGIDLGTTHIKSGIFNENASLCKVIKDSTPISKDAYGQVYDPDELYGVVKRQLLTLLEDFKGVCGISITGMAEAGLLINKKSNQIETPIIPWFEQRTQDLASRVSKEEDRDNFYATGLHNSYKYGIYKYIWLLDNYKLKREETIWLSLGDYILWKLTGQYATDPTYAARTYVYNINDNSWDQNRLNKFGLTKDNFPKVLPSGQKAGYVIDHDIKDKINGPPPMVSIGGHDHICAAYAVLDEDKNKICDSVGTAETYIGIDNTFDHNDKSYKSGMTYGPYLNNKDYFWMANIPSSGQSIEWFCNTLSKDKLDYKTMNKLVDEVGDKPTNILYFPYLSGMGTPLFNSDFRAGFLGLSQNHKTGDLIKSIMEGVNYQGRWILSMVPNLDLELVKDIICVGGATNSPSWMQIKANILGIPVTVPLISEASLHGAVLIMIDKNFKIEDKKRFDKRASKDNKTYQTNTSLQEAYNETYKQYTKILNMYLDENESE